MITALDVECDRYFRLTVKGPVGGEQLIEACLTLCGLLGRKGARNILVDVRGVQWLAATTDLHHFASTMEQPPDIRIALLCRADDPDAHFLETVAAHHCVLLQRFHDENLARRAVDT